MTDLHPLVQLAKDTIENYVRHGKTIQPPEKLTPEMEKRAGTFVSIHKYGMLRGCIGTIEPTQANVAQEVIQNAISAATATPQGRSNRPSRLPQLPHLVMKLPWESNIWMRWLCQSATWTLPLASTATP